MWIVIKVNRYLDFLVSGIIIFVHRDEDMYNTVTFVFDDVNLFCRISGPENGQLLKFLKIKNCHGFRE